MTIMTTILQRRAAFEGISNRMADILLPRGFDVVSEDLAPKTLDDVLEAFKKGHRFAVSSAHSSKTVFKRRSSNWAFRAWHDWTHAATGSPFDLQGETTVALSMIQLVRDNLGEEQARIARPFILIEVIGQVLYYELRGEFPEDQLAFTLIMANGFDL